jgi:hypothetical protein
VRGELARRRDRAARQRGDARERDRDRDRDALAARHGYFTAPPSTIDGALAVLLGQIAMTSFSTEENCTPGFNQDAYFADTSKLIHV